MDGDRQMCYTCMFSQTEGQTRVTCPSPASSVRSAASTCHVSRARGNWAARHARRPTTVNMDDSTPSGEAGRGRAGGNMTNIHCPCLALLQSQAMRSLQHHENNKLRSIWVLGSKKCFLFDFRKLDVATCLFLSPPGS